MPRILPNEIQAEFDASLWETPPIFQFISDYSKETDTIETDEMYRVFNMGLGMVIICSPENAPGILENIPYSKKVGKLQDRVSDNRVNIKNKK